MKKFIIFLLITFFISTVIAFYTGRKNIYKNTVARLGGKLLQNKPAEIDTARIRTIVTNAGKAIERENLDKEKIIKIDSVLQLLINKKMDSLEYEKGLKTLNKYLDTTKAKEK